MTTAIHGEQARHSPTGITPRLMIAQLLSAVSKEAPASLQQASATHFAASGKLLRGCLALEACAQFGATPDAAEQWAITVELLHNASLVHDDLCDRDTHRRGQKTVYRQYGEAVAICLGDYYLAKAYEHGAKAGLSSVPLISTAIATLVGGQAGEFSTVGYPGWDTYHQLAVAKTAPLLSLPVIGASVIADFAIDNAGAERYFEHAAICFQIINDLNNFNGTDGAQSPCSDLANCRPNAVIACFKEDLSMQQKARFELWADRIRSGELIADTVETREWWHLIKQSWAFAGTSDRLSFHYNTATAELSRLAPAVQRVIHDLQQWLAYELTKAKQLNFQSQE
ncbi:MAG: polyprenyl synthetase family protein [Pseudomonadales bacterium]|jgi:geranylgeranyl pyrophosphate synthase|nr:polyprenyl synthetase family protein [Pseudomonadales bacterium]